MEDAPYAVDEANSFRIREGVKQTGVNYRLKGPPEPTQIQRICHTKGDGDSSTLGLCLGFPDGARRGVHAPCLMSLLCQVQRVLPCPAPNVQDRDPDSACLFQAHELGLGPPDVPWRCSLICRIEELQTKTSRGQAQDFRFCETVLLLIPYPRR